MTDTKTKFKNICLKIINIPEITSIVPFVILVIVASILNPIFFKPANLLTLTGSGIGSWGLIAIGMAFIIIVGEIDISAGTCVGFASIMLSFMLKNGVSLFAGILLTFALTIGISMINAFVVVKLRVPVFIATIGMQLICKGMAKIVNYGAAIAIYATEYPEVRAFCDALADGPLGISWSFWAFAVLLVIGQIVLKKTTFGRRVYASGDNRAVAKVSGIKVGKMKTLCFLIMGVMLGITAVLWTGDYAGAQPIHGQGWEFIAIAAAAMGGVSLVGGKGSMLGVLFGVLSMAVLYNVITLLRINENFQNIFIGLFLAFSVIFDVIRREKMMGKNI